MSNRMKKMEAYMFLQNHGYAFLANVIVTAHSHPGRKLVAAARLVKEGKAVSLGATIDHLLIDGATAQWSDLH